MASVLIIGVGSSGMHALSAAQQFYYEFTKKNISENNVAMMFLETDQGASPQKTSNGVDKIRSCYLCPDNISATMNAWAQDEKYEWMPTEASVLNTHMGAGGHPAIGRIALWEKNYEVSQLLLELNSKIDDGDNDHKFIYIVGSLTGGTGTGVFIDLAYLVRNVLKNGNIYGMFMLPGTGEFGPDATRQKYLNAYTSLKYLDEFSVLGNSTSFYKCQLPHGRDITSNYPPFKNVQFFTQDFSNRNAALSNPAMLYPSVGFNLMLRILDVTNLSAPFQDIVNARLVDHVQNKPNGIFTTVGMFVFQFPESMLEEYFTLQLLEKDMLQRWSDVENYYLNTGDKKKHSLKTLDTSFSREASVFVQQSIDSVIEICKGHAMLEFNKCEDVVRNIVVKIIENTHGESSSDAFINMQFDANDKLANLFAAIHAQTIELRDELVRHILSKVKEESTRYENISAIRKLIEKIADSMVNVTKDWERRFHIDGTRSKWKNLWNAQLIERLQCAKWPYSACNCRTDYYYEAINGVVELCYFDALVPVLKELSESMKSNQNQNTIITANGEKLPTIYSADCMLTKVKNLLDGQVNDSLVSRTGILKAELEKGANSQFGLLFNRDTFDNDLKDAFTKYNNSSNKLQFKGDITSNSLWDFLNDSDNAEIKRTMIQRGLDKVKGFKLYQDVDIVKIMKKIDGNMNHPMYNNVHKLLKGTSSNIREFVPAMVQMRSAVDQFLLDDNYLKLILASNLDDSNNNGIVKAMTGYTVSSKNSNYVQLPSLQNTIVVYQEYCCLNNGSVFNPLINLEYQEQVRKRIEDGIQPDSKHPFDAACDLAYSSDAKEIIRVDNINIK